ncbi:hypothetical protein CABS02_03648, partial [Colletotrichum abscissum]
RRLDSDSDSDSATATDGEGRADIVRSTSFNDGDEGISDSTPFQLSQVRGLTRWWRRAPNIAVNDPWL